MAIAKMTRNTVGQLAMGAIQIVAFVMAQEDPNFRLYMIVCMGFIVLCGILPDKKL